MNSMKYVSTGVTTDYSKFVIPAHQRDRDDNSVKNVMSSIKENGVISSINVRPCLDDSDKIGEVYDGQHTLAACERLSVPVVYCLFTDVSNKAIIALNGKSRKWKLKNYLAFGVQDDNPDYILLDAIYRKEKMPLTALIMMYGGSYQNSAFKEINWKALTVDRGNDILAIVKDYERTYNIKHARFARFVWGLSKVYDTGLYDHKRMMLQLSKCSQLLTKQADPLGYIQNIEMVYNYGLQDKNKVQFEQKRDK